MLKKIDHIGIAVNDLEETSKFYRDMLGMEFCGIEEVVDQKVKVAFFEIGETHIELVCPTSPESAVAKHIERKGEGIHHICYATDDIVASLKELKDKGARLVDEVPRIGAHGAKIAFIHPKTSNGVLTELSQKQ
ncbi:methylmalonyl-CoA epimerase [bacterium]|nr:methylmalonyl-CoA epimerase [bacterium]